MTLLAPLALWFLAIAGAVVALYLLKIKRRQETVPALDFWLALAGRTKVHSLFDRLKRLLSMLLWLLIVACLALALANPILSLGKIKPRAIAIVLDNSASMQSSEPRDPAARVSDAPAGQAPPTRGSRLELARKAIEELTSTRLVSDQWLLIEAGRDTRVLQSWTYNAKAVRSAAQQVLPFGGAADVRPAVELASELLVGKPDPCIVVVSDGAAGVVEALAQKDPRVVPWPIGRTNDNLGITRLAVRSDRQRGNYHCLLAVTNASDQAVDTQVTLRIDAATFSVELVHVDPGATWEKTIVIDPPGEVSRTGAVLRATLERPDALRADNESYAILQPIRPATVWLVSPPETAFFFEQALGAMDPMVAPEQSLTMTPEQYERVSAALAGTVSDPARDMPRPDIIVFNNVAPKQLPPTGRMVFLNRWPDGLPTGINGELSAPQLFLAPRPHPIIDHVTLQGAHLSKAARVTLKESGRVLANTAEGDPLMVLFEQPDRQCLCLAFDVLNSDLPFRNAFPLLLRNTVAFMHEDAPALLPPELGIGQTLRPTRLLPPQVREVALGILGDGGATEKMLPVTDRSFACRESERPGALRVKLGEDLSYSAIALNDVSETRIQPLTLPPDQDPVTRLSLSRGIFGVGGVPWFALAAFASILVVLEWLTFHFRWTE